MHTVCAVMTDAFLVYSRLAGNDLSTPRPEYGFAGPARGRSLVPVRGPLARSAGCGRGAAGGARGHARGSARRRHARRPRAARQPVMPRFHRQRDAAWHTMIGEPRVVAAGTRRGVVGATDGASFRTSSFTWIGIIVIYIVISLLLNAGADRRQRRPGAAHAGVHGRHRCSAAVRIERDGTLRVAHLFEGFQGAHFVPLMIIGVVNIAFFVGLVLLGAARRVRQRRPRELARLRAPIRSTVWTARSARDAGIGGVAVGSCSCSCGRRRARDAQLVRAGAGRAARRVRRGRDEAASSGQPAQLAAVPGLRSHRDRDRVVTMLAVGAIA